MLPFRTRKSRRAARRPLHVESLEARRVLTVLGGNVVAQLTGGTLRLTGDALPNQVVVASVTGGKMAVIGLPGTTVNGSPNTFVTIKPVTNIVANLGAGDDAVGFSNNAQALNDLSGTVVPDVLVAALQTAIDTVAAGQRKFVLPGGITLAAGAGDDAIGLVGDVGGSVVANLGPSSAADFPAGNVLGIGNASGSADPLLHSSVGGSLSVVGGQQTDVVDIVRTTVAGSIASALGAGSNFTGIYDSTVRGGLAVSGAGGSDESYTEGSTIRGAVSASLGDGDNVFVADKANLGGLAVATGSGEDFLYVTNSRVRTDVAIASGAGDDSVLLYGYEGRIVVVGGSMAIDTGAGADGLQISTSTAGSVTASTGDGRDLVYMFTSTVGASVVLSTLGGDDFVKVEDVAVAYGLTIDLGAGNDSLELATTRALAAWLYGGPGTNSLATDAASQTGIRRIYAYQFQAR